MKRITMMKFRYIKVRVKMEDNYLGNNEINKLTSIEMEEGI